MKTQKKSNMWDYDCNSTKQKLLWQILSWVSIKLVILGKVFIESNLCIKKSFWNKTHRGTHVS